jgi:hypothetical protein
MYQGFVTHINESFREDVSVSRSVLTDRMLCGTFFKPSSSFVEHRLW